MSDPMMMMPSQPPTDPAQQATAQVPEQAPPPGLVQAIVAALRNWGGGGGDVDARADTARDAAEETSKVLPASLMPRGAIEHKRSQMQQMDDMLRQ